MSENMQKIVKNTIILVGASGFGCVLFDALLKLPVFFTVLLTMTGTSIICSIVNKDKENKVC